MLKLPIEVQIKLNQFKPREYQEGIINALERDNFKKIFTIWPRRSGKDFTIFNLVIKAALRRVGSYFYCLPTFKQARLVIFDSITIDGKRFLDFIPSELVYKKNVQEMKITLINGSIIQFIGSDTYDTSLVGTNPVMVIFSEYALADDRAYKFVRPILNANDGVVIVCSTPRGHNHFHDLYQIAKHSPEWYCQKLTIDDTAHISVEQIKREIHNGEMSEELARQEYWTDFSMGIEGSYYGRYIDKMRLENRISEVPWEPAYPVHCSFDLGMKDSTCIVFFQIIGSVIHIIDCYDNHSQGLEHYVNHLHSKPYTYGKIFAPHDIQVRELGTGVSRLEKARSLGLNLHIAPKLSVLDGIEAVRSMLPKCWIDEKKCARLIKALENYRKEYDHKRKVYNEKPLHNEHSDFSDATRYMALSLPKCGKGSSPEELERRYQETRYGTQHDLPRPFRETPY